MTSPLRLGIAGLGTVGVGLVKIVQRNPDLLALRAGRPITISAVCAQSRTRNRGVDISAYAWEDDPVACDCGGQGCRHCQQGNACHARAGFGRSGGSRGRRVAV